MKKFHLSLTGSTTMSSLVETLVKNFVPDLLLMYSQHNYQSSSQFKAYNPTVPEYLHDRPKTFITACLKTALAASHHDDWDIHVFGNGKFEVKSEKKSERCNVYLGDEDRYPFCDCVYFSSNFMPCKHMFAIFNHTDYTWDVLPTSYRNHVLYTLDTGCISEGNGRLWADIDMIKGEDKGENDSLESSSTPHGKEINEEVSEVQKQLRDNIKVLSDLSYLSTDIKNLKKAAEYVKKTTNLLKSTVETSKSLPVHRGNTTNKARRELSKRKKGRTKKRKHSSAGEFIIFLIGFLLNFLMLIICVGVISYQQFQIWLSMTSSTHRLMGHGIRTRCLSKQFQTASNFYKMIATAILNNCAGVKFDPSLILTCT